MRVADLGEFPLIERLIRLVAGKHPYVVLGPGDDAAVLRVPKNHYLVATMDGHVEGIHFRRDLIPPEDLGHRCLAVNLSDMAAMAAQPAFALVALTLPPDVDVAWVEDLYRGLVRTATAYDVVVVGGNIARSPGPMVIDLALLGWARPKQWIGRGGARPGDRVLVTGTLGEAAAGLQALLHPEWPLDEALRQALASRYRRPTPRVREALVLAETKHVTAMLDLSDGLAGDIRHLCRAGQVGVRLWAARLPVSEGVRQVALLLGQPVWHLALHGGEDYELCLTAAPEHVPLLQARMASLGTRLTEIGEIVPQGNSLVLPDGTEIPLPAGGWQHFSAAQIAPAEQP